MKFRSQVYTAVSGSVGGLTYAHNAGGMYTRGRGTPTNPNSTRQQLVRNNMSLLATAWSQTLTQAQRDGWQNYAQNTPVTDAFGEPLVLSGQQMYNRCNAARLSANIPALARVDAPPTTMGMPDLIATAALPNDAAGDADITFDDTVQWVNDDGAAMLVYMSRQVSPTINFFKGPYRFAGAVEGDSVTPPTDPATINSPFGETFAAGNRVFFRLILTAVDGRISPKIHLSGIVA